MTTITGTLNAYIISKWTTLDDIKKTAADGRANEAVERFTFSNADIIEADEWVKIGKATITVTLSDEQEITKAQVKALEQALQEVRAQAYVKEQAIQSRINNLLAIAA